MHDRIAPGSGLWTLRALWKLAGDAEEGCGDDGALPCAWQRDPLSAGDVTRIMHSTVPLTDVALTFIPRGAGRAIVCTRRPAFVL